MQAEMTVFQFGDFLLDPQRRQLRRGEELLSVTGKAFDLLAYMGANAGRPIEKSELLQAVWPDSFVEESNLSQNVFLLRKVLGSGPGSPIQTLAGKGYLFATPVTEVVQHAQPGLHMLEATHTRVVLEEESEEHIAAWRSPWVIGLSAAGLVLLGVAGWLGWQRWEDRAGGPPVQAVLTNFTSNTGDPVLNHTLEDALRIDLSQSPFVTVVSTANIRRTLIEMAHKPDDALTPELAHDLCERTSSQVVLQAAIAKTGSHYLMTAQATNCVDGALVASDKREVSTQNDLPSAIQQIAATLRHGLGESRRSIARFDTTLLPAVTPSLEALEDYSQETRLAQQGKFPEGISLLKHAVSLDPKFAAAYLDLAVDSADTSDFQMQREYLRKAYEVREYATEPMRRVILAQYDAVVTGDLHQSVRDILAWTELYPRSAAAWAALSEVYRELEMPAESAAAAQRALALSPKYSVLYYALALGRLGTGDLSAARTVAEDAIRRGYDTDQLHMILVSIGHLTHDDLLLQQQAAWASAHPGSVFTTVTETQAMQDDGRFKASHDLLGSVARELEERGQALLVPVFEQQLALGYLTLGDPAAARALAHPEFRDDDTYLSALLPAEFGDDAKASAELARHLHIAGQGTLWNHLHGPNIRARIFLHQNHPQEALDALSAAAEFFDRDLDVRLTRALTFHALHDLPKAETDLRFILAHPYLDAVSSAIPAAEFELAIVLQEEGKTGEAQQMAHIFLVHWHQADPGATLYRRALDELHASEL